MEHKVAHLQMIQTVISRMATNSFLLKGWTVTLISALFVLADSGSDRVFLLVAAFPTVVFWLLDGYFLGQERCYRALYDQVRSTVGQDVDFSLNARTFATGKNGWFGAVRSTTLVLFYGGILGVLLVIWLVTVC